MQDRPSTKGRLFGLPIQKQAISCLTRIGTQSIKTYDLQSIKFAHVGLFKPQTSTYNRFK